MKHSKGIDKGKVILYALSTCQWCRKTKDLLRDLNIDYYYVDVDLADNEKQKELVEEIKKFNPSCSFPTLVIEDKDCIIGFDEEKIKEKFKKQ